MLDYLLPFSDETSECSYRPDQTARLPMKLPLQAISPAQFDELMELGYRRSGTFFYHTQCPSCRACQPIRLEVSRFRPNRSQRRSLKSSTGLRFELAQPTVCLKRIQLFNVHRDQRGLNRFDTPVDAGSYRSFLLNAPNDSGELSLWDGDRLVAVSITDFGLTSLSAVYCFFDPEYAGSSPGTACILKQVELAMHLRKELLYLGYYVAANSHLSYKANFRPHQRRIDGVWQDFS